jgi:hypothetical protein
MTDGLSVRGRVRVLAHPPGTTYHRDLLEGGRVLVDERNTLNQLGLDHIARMLLADPINDPRLYGITQMALFSGATQVYKDVLTDHYTSGSSVVSVLFLPSTLPVAQPVSVSSARLYVDELGDVLLATKVFDPVISKTSLLSLTLDWTVTLAAG